MKIKVTLLLSLLVFRISAVTLAQDHYTMPVSTAVSVAEQTQATENNTDAKSGSKRWVWWVVGGVVITVIIIAVANSSDSSGGSGGGVY